VLGVTEGTLHKRRFVLLILGPIEAIIRKVRRKTKASPHLVCGRWTFVPSSFMVVYRILCKERDPSEKLNDTDSGKR
jgi:hypothetical protein